MFFDQARKNWNKLTDVDKHYEATDTTSVEDIWSSCFMPGRFFRKKSYTNTNQKVDVEDLYKKLLNDIRFETMESLCPLLKKKLQINDIEQLCNERKAVYHRRIVATSMTTNNLKEQINDESYYGTLLQKTRSHFKQKTFNRHVFH